MAGEALARCVGDVGCFTTAHWGRRPMLRRDAGPFDDLLDIAAIESLLADLGRRPTFRLVRDGTPVPPAEYTLRTRVGGADIDDVADVDRILDHVNAGATVVMQGLQRFWPPLARFCLDLEADLGHAVQANAYLSPPSAAGLARHADRHDVLVVQVSGSKEWAIAGLGDLTLTAGDVMYLPAGTHHSARTTGAASLHITLGLLVTTHRDVLQRLVTVLDDPELDRPLPIGFATDAALPGLVEALSDSLQRAARHLAETDAAALATNEATRRRRRARRRWTGRLRYVVDPASLAIADVVRRRRPFDLHDDGDRVVLDVPDRRLRLPASTSPALHRLRDADDVAVGDLPGLDDADRLVLVRRLLREGIVDVVT